MRYVRLGKTELEVSAIAFGTWAFGGDWGSFDAHESKAVIHHALDLGVTFFDTAQAYGFGVSERLLAVGARAPRRRDRRHQGRPSHGGPDTTQGRERPLATAGRRVESPQPAHRLHRSVPGSLARPEDAAGGDGARPRGPGARGQDPARRRLELRRQAD